MALINCPNCNNLVSDKAIKCPHCGIDLTSVGNVPNTEVNAPVEKVEPISQIDQKFIDKASNEASHTLRNVLIGIAVLFVICGGCGALWFYYSSNKVITTSSNLDIAKIVAEIDRDMAAKVNDDAIEKQKAEKRLEEFKNFQSNDLAAFMLHGKVKEVTYFSGQCFTHCEFDESGVLIKYVSGDNHYEDESRISHDGNELCIIHEEQSDYLSIYNVVDYKLIDEGESENHYYYSDFDSNNWPQTVTIHEGFDEPSISTAKIVYSNIDEYGNWTTMKREDGYTKNREIKYYPIQ